MSDPFSAVLAAIPGLAKAAEAIANAADPGKRMGQFIELQKMIVDLQSNIGTIQVQNMSLVQEKTALQAECARLEDWAAEKMNYSLVEFSTGMFAYVHKDNSQRLQNAPKFCAACFENGKRALLQMQSGVERKRGLFCPTCKTTLWLYHNRWSDEQHN